jgi:hypothetical protein
LQISIERPRLGSRSNSEDKKLHQNKSDESCRWNSEELCDQDIVGDRGEADLHGRDGGQPTGENHGKILHKLTEIIVPPASKYPELVQQKMARHADKVPDRDRDQRQEEVAKQPDGAEVHDRNRPPDHTKSDNAKNSLLIQHGDIFEKFV